MKKITSEKQGMVGLYGLLASTIFIFANETRMPYTLEQKLSNSYQQSIVSYELFLPETTRCLGMAACLLSTTIFLHSVYRECKRDDHNKS